MRILWPRKGTRMHKIFCYLVFVLLRAFLWLNLSALGFNFVRKHTGIEICNGIGLKRAATGCSFYTEISTVKLDRLPGSTVCRPLPCSALFGGPIQGSTQ
ncbi:Unannotated [Lentimonas sp. CC4]|nr:Unannotated [Lentimonas sp. CC4]CAA6685270.1 Unannotated [Lentimonas sp. CC6]CAA7075005.1 Unannotated [Lentimonas sp. CC4]CAA7171052.1 Unannotated [Lentimonas sp. CC21]CAA7180647.1 Unannotated [Lentimonas sp. CC8]